MASCRSFFLLVPLFKQSVILIMMTDPEPVEIAVFRITKGSIFQIDSDRPKTSNLFKLEGRMIRIFQPEEKLFPCVFLISGGNPV